MDMESIKGLLNYGPLGIFCAVFIVFTFVSMRWFAKRADLLINRHVAYVDATEKVQLETKQVMVSLKETIEDHARREEQFMQSIASMQKDIVALHTTRA